MIDWPQKITINVFDNDYRTYIGSHSKEFFSYDEVEEYCSNNTWDGETYLPEYPKEVVNEDEWEWIW